MILKGKQHVLTKQKQVKNKFLLRLYVQDKKQQQRAIQKSDLDVFKMTHYYT